MKEELKKLIGQLRKEEQYLFWKNDVLREHVPSYPNVPKNIQVHHIVSMAEILEAAHITTVEQALAYEPLWDTWNGQVLWKGEHYAITFLERFKRVSPGLIRLIESWKLKVIIEPVSTQSKKAKK